MSHRFFQQGVWSVGQTIEMDSEESYHASRVLRLTEGTAVDIFNGEGLAGVAVLRSVGKDAVEMEVTAAQVLPNPWLVTVAFSLGKPASAEFILKRATELGVRRFQPLRSMHSHPGDFKVERWRKILLEVCKQCQETHVPQLEPIQPLDSWLREWAPKPILFCDEGDRNAQPQSLQRVETAVLLGPEGGWDPSEISLVRGSSQNMGLGRNRLRAETAALVSAVVVKQALGEIPGSFKV